jgi:hypothetical protein
MPGGGVREFRPGQEFIPGGGMGLAANADEFVPGGGTGGVREFRPGQEFMPGGVMALAANAGEFVPSFVAQQVGEFVPGHQFMPGGMDGGYDGRSSMMQAIPDDYVCDYGDNGAVYDENGEYVHGNEYAADDEEEGWMEITGSMATESHEGGCLLSLTMLTGVICDTRNLEARGFGFIKPDTGETCEGG